MPSIVSAVTPHTCTQQAHNAMTCGEHRCRYYLLVQGSAFRTWRNRQPFPHRPCLPSLSFGSSQTTRTSTHMRSVEPSLVHPLGGQTWWNWPRKCFEIVQVSEYPCTCDAVPQEASRLLVCHSDSSWPKQPWHLGSAATGWCLDPLIPTCWNHKKKKKTENKRGLIRSFITGQWS